MSKIQQIFNSTLKALLKNIPESNAWERALNLCLVLGNLRPACLWYMDIHAEESIALLSAIDTDELGFSVGMGTVAIKKPGSKKKQSINVPHTLIFRLDNEKAVKLAQSDTFDKDMFASHREMGEALGYSCAGD